MDDGEHVSPATIVGVFATEHDAIVYAARHYPDPEHYVTITRAGAHTWTLHVDDQPATPHPPQTFRDADTRS